MHALPPIRKTLLIINKNPQSKSDHVENLNSEIENQIFSCNSYEDLHKIHNYLSKISLVFNIIQDKINGNSTLQEKNYAGEIAEENFQSMCKFILENEIIFNSIENICVQKYNFKTNKDLTRTAQKFLKFFHDNLNKIVERKRKMLALSEIPKALTEPTHKDNCSIPPWSKIA